MKHKYIKEITGKKRSGWTKNEIDKVNEILDGLNVPNFPIYAYVKKREVYFQIRYRNVWISGYRNREDALKYYESLIDGTVSIEH